VDKGHFYRVNEDKNYLTKKAGNMVKNPITTTDLAEFGSRERYELVKLLEAWDKQGLPEDFEDDEVTPMMNKMSGNVFLTNSDYQVAMMNGDKLESWYTCCNCGHEGFAEDCQLKDDGCNECTECTEEVD
jgi:hypothetical protein